MSSIINYFVLAVAALSLLLITCNNVHASDTIKQPPHIIYILADDLGYNNVGIQQQRHNTEQNTSEVKTPTIDELTKSGLELSRMYSYKYCSPSRSSFLSGRLPIHVTQNNKNNLVTNPGGADLRMKLLPEVLKERLNYKTHMVGKWHVGARSTSNLPINRGFDSHFGFLKGGEDHLNQHSGDAGITFVDLWRDQKPAFNENGTFSTIIYTNEAVKIIKQHSHLEKNKGTKQPLFMFLAYQATHTPLEVPPSWNVKPVPDDTKTNARSHMNALVEILDSGVKNVTDALKETGMWENTLLIFQADNGGWVTDPSLGGNNYPLRGGKVSDYEGGVRNFAFINGGYMPDNLKSTTFSGLMHICDWYETFQNLAPNFNEEEKNNHDQINNDVPPLDSINQWNSLLVPNGEISKRHEVPLAFCTLEAQCDSPGGVFHSVGDAALIVGKWKIINGTQNKMGIWQGPLYPNASSLPANDAVGCPNGCLFNIFEDPGERFEKKEEYPDIFKRLMERLKYYGTTVYQTNYTDAKTCIGAPESYRMNHGFLAPRCSTDNNDDYIVNENKIERLSLDTELPKPYELRTEFLKSDYSLSLSTFHAPRFSWKLPLLPGDKNRGKDQAAYRIIVRERYNTGVIVWDSNIVSSNASNLVEYNGDMNLLVPDKSYSWTVQYFYQNKENDDDLIPSGISSTSSFDIGLMVEKDWENAKWIGDENHRLIRVNVLPLSTNIVRARVHLSAPGCAVLSVNGKTHPFSAGGVCPWTNFNKTIYYQSYDILNMLVFEKDKSAKMEKQTFGFMLGHGMYYKYGLPGTHPTIKVKIVLEDDKGMRTLCVSGSSSSSSSRNNANVCHWYGTEGPYISDDPFDGTEIDWNRLPDQWDTPMFDPLTRGWSLVPTSSNVPSSSALIKGMAMPPTIDKRTYKPLSVKYFKNEYGGPVYVYDIGTNIVGTCSILLHYQKKIKKAAVDKEFMKVNNAAPTIALRHGEMLLNNGSINFNYSGHSSGVKATFQKDLHHLPTNMNEGETIRLRSSFVWFGFQYISVEISNGAEAYFDAKDLQNSIECYQKYPDFDVSGEFFASDDKESNESGSKLNALQKIITTSQLGNLADYAPTDCPTREKHFWLGDSLSVAEEAMLNYHVPTLFNNFLNIIADEQGNANAVTYEWDFPGVVPVLTHKSSLYSSKSIAGPNSFGITDISWTAAFPIILNWMHRHYGDVQIVKDLYGNAKQYVDGLSKEANILLNSTLPTFFIWGDWCSNQSRAVATPETGPTASAFNYILSLDAMADMASVLGKDNDFEKYSTLSKSLRITWAKTFYNSNHGLYGYEAEDGFVSQTLTSASFVMNNVVPNGVSYENVLNNYQKDIIDIRKNHVTFGSVGAKNFFQQTSKNSGHDIALNVALQDTYPSFGYWIKQGATSCWEDWTGYADPTHPPQPTHNHIFLCGGLGEWLYTNVGGIALPEEIAFKKILIAPKISELVGPASVRTSFNSPYGLVKMEWNRTLSAGEIKALSISINLPKYGTIIIPLNNNNRKEEYQLMESERVIFKHGKFIGPNIIPGIMNVVYDNSSNSLIVECSRGIYMFDLLSSA